MPEDTTSQHLAASLQLSVLAALAYDKRGGAAVAAQVEPRHFDTRYRDVAARILTYRTRYSVPPGKSHIADIVAQSSFGAQKVSTARFLAELEGESVALNTDYVVSRVSNFIRQQTLKAAIFEAGDRYNSLDDALADDVETILSKALRSRVGTVDAGLRLSDPAGLAYLEPQPFYPISIPVLDQLRIGPAPKQSLLYIAAKNTGKTWFCVHVGRQCLLQGLKVLHVSLEMDRGQIIKRYYQSFFGVSLTPERIPVTLLDRDEGLDRLSGFHGEQLKPRLAFSSPKIQTILKRKLKEWGARFDNLVVIDYPTSSLTVNQLTAYLNYLEEVERFVPHVLIVDYPDLMAADRKNYRLEIGQNFIDLRGLVFKRNMALVVPTQSSRIGMGAKRVRSTMASEDIQKVFAADNVLTFSQTEAEGRYKLARLHVDHARFARKGSEILLAQAYDIGAYVLDSAHVQQAYWDQLGEREDGTEAE